jgi:hypothetical protein
VDEKPPGRETEHREKVPAFLQVEVIDDEQK